MLDSCFETELLAFSIPDINSYNPGETLTKELPFVYDTIGQGKQARQNGSPYCAERVYEIVSSDSDFLQVNGDNFSFDTNTPWIEMNK